MNLPVFSLFPYSKKGEENAVTTAKKIVVNTKACRVDFINKYFNEKISEKDKIELSEFISKDATLIPIPKSAPLLENALWPSLSISELLINNGFGKNVMPLIKRIQRVQKAAFQDSSDDRPTVAKHYESFTIENDPIFSNEIKEIILIDDVVTQGRTAYACYLRIRELFPDIPVKLFALIRSDSFEKITDWNLPLYTEIVYYTQSGKTFHQIHKSDLKGLFAPH